MTVEPTPTFGRVLEILRGLGFITEPAKPGVLLLAHTASGAEFLFRERAADTPARPSELVNLRVQLTARGLMTEAELDARLSPATQPAPAS